MTLEDSIHSQRLRVVRDAEQLGNVSEACRRHGMSRTVFYRLRTRFEQYGPDGVHPKRRQARRGRPPAIAVQTERRVIAFALAWPTCGPQWYSDQLARDGVPVAPVTVWRLSLDTFYVGKLKGGGQVSRGRNPARADAIL